MESHKSEDAPNVIYTYLPAKFAISDIIHQHLKLCEADKANDLMEYWFELVFPGKSEKGSFSDMENRRNVKEQFRERIAEYARAMKFVSFSETNSSMPMWAHYGDDCGGVCLGFQFKLMIDGDNLVQKIDYEKPVSVFLQDGNDPRPKEYFHNQIRRILTTKRPDWSYEKECRLFVPPNCDRFEHGLDDKRFFRFFRNEIKAVFFGTRCPSIDIGKIGLACMSMGFDVKFFMMKKRLRAEFKEYPNDCDADSICQTGTAYREEYIPCLLSRKKMSRYMNFAILQCGVDPHCSAVS